MNAALESSCASESASTISRACGALALMDVMKRWNIETSLPKVWEHVSQADPFGGRCARSYRLAAYAKRFGLHAVALKCRESHAWDALIQCARLGLSVIVNHQAQAARHEGHFSTLLNISKRSLVAFDPILRATVAWSRETFLAHWHENSEITGHVLIAIQKSDEQSSSKAMSSRDRCPSCGETIDFEPVALFDPVDWQPGGLWRNFFCPGCDASFG